MCAIITGSAQFLRSRSNPNKGTLSGSVYWWRDQDWSMRLV